MIILEDNSNERASGDKTLEAEGPEVLVPELPTVLPPPYTPQPPHADLLETQTLQTMLSHPGTSNSRPPSALWRFFKALGYALLIITLARMLVWGMNFPSHGRREHHKRRGSLVHQKSHGMERVCLDSDSLLLHCNAFH